MVPGRKAAGTKIAAMTRTVAITGLHTSPIALIVASLGGRWSCTMLRSTFSTTTMASSTTMPIASTRPNRVSRLIEKPRASISGKVPSRATTTAVEQMTVERKFCRNR